MAGSPESFTTTCNFQQTPHSVSVACDLQRLSITVEQLTDSSEWRAEYPLELVEQITSKAGSFKPCAVFLRMLLAGLQHESETVDVELLTYEDLDTSSSSSLAADGEQPNNGLATRRYLIVTHSSEFDRTQYPLPLQYVSNPDPGYLKGIIRELRSRHPSPQVHPPSKPESDQVQQLRSDVLALQRKLQKQGLVQDELQTAQTQNLALTRQLQEVARERDAMAEQLQEAELRLPVQPYRARRISRNPQQERSSSNYPSSRHGWDHASPLRRRSSEAAGSYSKWPTGHAGRRSWDSGSDMLAVSQSTGQPGGGRRASRPPLHHTSNLREPASRSRSAPARRERFDPTQYVCQQLDRYRQPRMARSPVPSRAPSRSPSPSVRTSSAGHLTLGGAGEESSVLDRLCRPTASFRARSGSPDPRQASPDPRQGSLPTQPWPRHSHSPASALHDRSLRSASPAKARPPRQSSPAAASYTPHPRQWGGRSSPTGSSPSSSHAASGLAGQASKENRRPASPLGPGVPLPAIHCQQASYPQAPDSMAASPPHGRAKAASRKALQPPAPSFAEDSDQSVDLASIDARLAKLQSFLQAARAGRPTN